MMGPSSRERAGGKRELGVRFGFTLGWDQGVAVAGVLRVGDGPLQGGKERSQSIRLRG